MATVYLLHFDRPLGNPANPRALASHYLGWAVDLEARIAAHQAGRGSHLTRAAVAQGIPFSVVATWPGDWRLEQQLKALKSSPRLCPMCGRRHRRGPLCVDSPYRQLGLELEPDWPAPPPGRADWFERRWFLSRAVSVPTGLATADTSACDIPF